MDMRFEAVVLPVSDVDRAKRFYQGLGWREDADFGGDGDFRIVQLTPPGSADATSLPRARFHVEDASLRAPGLAPGRGTYRSFASFSDPDGNGWVVQEITTRLPGRE